MKKVLFASTALVAAALASTSFAAEKVTGSVGGYMMIGLVYQTDSGDEIGILRDGEIHLKFSGTSDNGLTFSGRVELEAFTATGDQIDENWAQVSGSFGAIRIGSDDTASDAHEAGIFYGPQARTGYFDSFYAPIGSDNGGDVPMIRYTTPNFSGFELAVDWAPNSGADGANDGGLVFGDNSDNPNLVGGMRYSVGASYSGEFSGVALGLGAGYVDGDDFTDGVYQLGAQVGFSGFTIGVHYDSSANYGTNNAGIALGGEYTTGPWTFGAGYAMTVEGPDVASWGVWGTYALAEGVDATLGYEGSDIDTPLGGDTHSVSAYLTIGF